MKSAAVASNLEFSYIPKIDPALLLRAPKSEVLPLSEFVGLGAPLVFSGLAFVSV